MTPFSIVIVAKDSADKIGRLLESLRGLTDDVIVCDTGSSDATIEIARAGGAKVHTMPWEGYGKSKNRATQLARHDWVLSLDSDERIDPMLYQALKEWKPVSDQTVHQVLWKNYFGDQWIRYSDWGSSWKNRLFNRHTVNWDDAIAHEDLESARPLHYQRLPGYLDHFSFKDSREYATKMVHSAMITAQKYHTKGKKAGIGKIIFSPWFSFIKSYFIKRGFLDGYKGWLIAVTTAYYSFIKYARLRELNSQAKNKT
jgi:glycosyltransferase involved in cell wall biosynthesis